MAVLVGWRGSPAGANDSLIRWCRTDAHLPWLPYPLAGDARPVPISFRSGRWAPSAPGNGHGSKVVMRVSAWWPSAARLVAELAGRRRLLCGRQGDMG